MEEIGKNVEYLMESVELLRHIGSGQSYEELRESLNRKYGHTMRAQDTFQKKIKLLVQIEKRAEAVFAEDKELLEYYFNDKEDRECFCGSLVILWERIKSGTVSEDTKKRKQDLENMQDEEYYRAFGGILQEYGKAIVEEKDSEMTTPLEIIRYLMKMDLPMEEKWKLQDILLNRREHQEKVFYLLEKAEAVLKNFESELKEMAEAFYCFWQEKTKGKTLEAYLNEVFLESPANPFGCCLSPSFLSPNRMALYADCTDEGEFKTPYYVTIGFFLGENLDIDLQLSGDGKEKEEQVLQTLKLLSEKSKFEILAYIQKKAAYGSELAKHLDLTTATISHHMNALVAKGLVTIAKEENRIYYRSNKKAIGELLDYCRNVLLGERDYLEK